MPTLDRLNRAQAFTLAARVPYRLLEEVSVHTAAAPDAAATPPDLTAQADLLENEAAPALCPGAKVTHLLNDPYGIEKRQVGELWARKSKKRCLFGQIALQKNGVGMAGQLDALLN